MRLETPVIYFHPSAGTPLPRRLDVDVAFRGGWLTEFYPEAQVLKLRFLGVFSGCGSEFWGDGVGELALESGDASFGF
jgi:hypothetical protein